MHSVEPFMKPTTDEQAFAAMLEGMEADAPRELARLAALAAALEHVRAVAGPPPAAFRASLRNRILAESAVRRPWLERVSVRMAERNARMRRSFKFVFANAVAAAMLLAGGSLVAVAQTSVPGDWSYFAKRLHEDARLLVTRAPEPRAFMQLSLARERLDEVRELVNRGQQSAAPYFTALNDMDARTLDATKLLVQVYGKTHDRSGLDRLTQFAAAQRNGLEVLVDRLPAAARPPARDSIDILERVSERVTGILGGCPCPANPLVPPSTPDLGGGTSVDSSSGQTETPLCPCNQIRGNDGNEPSDGGSNGNPPVAQPPNEEEPPPAEEPGEGPIILPSLPVVDDTVDDVVNDLIDKVLDPLEPVIGPDPLPTIQLPPLLGR